MAESVVPNESLVKYAQTYCVTNLFGFLGVYNLCYSTQGSLFTAVPEGKKTLAEREVGLATIIGILNTPVRESDQIRD